MKSTMFLFCTLVITILYVVFAPDTKMVVVKKPQFTCNRVRRPEPEPEPRVDSIDYEIALHGGMCNIERDEEMYKLLRFSQQSMRTDGISQELDEYEFAGDRAL